ncbi:hypothetical protein B0J18DRAFT_426071 [Chaetomium sp. MPI-SDFR-AT-0129]|nr:hypothetical protein B0J18DRAFT_426071 [Chaetomium sp. MPI-SDFR-AT-0129]
MFSFFLLIYPYLCMYPICSPSCLTEHTLFLPMYPNLNECNAVLSTSNVAPCPQEFDAVGLKLIIVVVMIIIMRVVTNE